MLYELLSIWAALRMLSFRRTSPGTGPYVGSWGIEILDRRTGETLLSLCHTPDGWCIRPWKAGAGLYRRFSWHDRQLWMPEKWIERTKRGGV